MAFRNGVIAAGAAALTAALVTTVPALGATAFTISGTRIFHDPAYPEQVVPGQFAGYDVEHVKYPASVIGMDRGIRIAADALAARVDSAVGTDEDIIVAGLSQGAIVIAYEKKRLMALSEDERPDPGQLKFVTVGDPTGPGGILRWVPGRIPIIGLTPVRPPDTPYETVIINGEYDGWADFPDRPWNLLSTANALLGIIYVHGRYEDKPGGWDLSTVPEKNIVVTENSLGGKTTSYLIPTEKLPLLQPLRDLGFPESFVAALEKVLRPLVDAGYKRNDPVPVTGSTEETPAVEESDVTAAVNDVEEADEPQVTDTQGVADKNVATARIAKAANTVAVTEDTSVTEEVTDERTAEDAEAAKDAEATKDTEAAKDTDVTQDTEVTGDSNTTEDPGATQDAGVVKADETDKTDQSAEEAKASEKADAPAEKKSNRPRLNLFTPKKPKVTTPDRVTVPKAEPAGIRDRGTKDDDKQADTDANKDAA